MIFAPLPAHALHRSQSPLVTVGIPVFNGERWLADAIDSILAQTLDDFILVLADNASTDGTRAICERYAMQDSRVQYRRSTSNIGLFRNYDRAFQLSSTKYFKWASCSDICGERFLELCVDVLERRPDVVLAHTETALFEKDIGSAVAYEGGIDLQQERPSERVMYLLSNLKLNNMINGVIRSDVLRQTALNRVYTGSDINLVAELALHGKFVEIPEMLFFRRMTTAASSVMVPESERKSYFADEPRDVLELREWRLAAGFFSALCRAPLPFAERLQTAGYLTRQFARNRAKLWHELAIATKSRISRLVLKCRRR